MKKKLAILIIIWTIAYFAFLKLVFGSIDSVSNSAIYFASLFSYALIACLIPPLFKKISAHEKKLFSFFIPFIFGTLLVTLFIVGMANIESFYSATIMNKILKSLALLPYAVGKGLLLGVPMGALGYLFGGLASLITKKK